MFWNTHCIASYRIVYICAWANHGGPFEEARHGKTRQDIWFVVKENQPVGSKSHGAGGSEAPSEARRGAVPSPLPRPWPRWQNQQLSRPWRSASLEGKGQTCISVITGIPNHMQKCWILTPRSIFQPLPIPLSPARRVNGLGVTEPRWAGLSQVYSLSSVLHGSSLLLSFMVDTHALKLGTSANQGNRI